ncbi:hypothetical protein CFHF_19650 [Caulobacter flavus]|uniref:RNA polymerase subunit sigma-70 n=1 Tax=Caulobacter flavus TaxID=1679497 RepID=A0A2N5CP09_9CAUL|nr:RNA polymerase sigma factor [Caulobacter flavus]AYV48610.1 hypothetical protein C1707_21415 [Caulobacter flavus]PLR08674.1 hypothetical protein CFHF_19650 [Caulobacter flavus]
MDGFSPPVAAAPTTLEAWFRRYGAWLTPILRRRYGDLAEDLTHEALLRAAARGSETPNHKAFLLTIADNLARDHMRRQRRESTHATKSEPLTPRTTPASQEQLLQLKEIVLALPPELRDVFVLTRLRGLTYSDIVELRGIPLGTVKDRVRRAFALVSAAMGDEGGPCDDQQ